MESQDIIIIDWRDNKEWQRAKEWAEEQPTGYKEIEDQNPNITAQLKELKIPLGTVNCFLFKDSITIHSSSLFRDIPLQPNIHVVYPFLIYYKVRMSCNSLVSKHLATKEFLTYLNSWLQKLGLLDADFKVIENFISKWYYLEIQDKEKKLIDFTKPLTEIISILAMLYSVPEHSFVIINYPEAYVHPKAQFGLADLFLDMAIKRNLGIIVITHSEYILRRLQRNIAEGCYNQNQVNIILAEGNLDKLTLTNLALNEYGEILNYPNDLFGDVMTEIAETRKAILKRKMNTTV